MNDVWIFDDWKTGRNIVFLDKDVGIQYVMDEIEEWRLKRKHPLLNESDLKLQADLQLEDAKLVWRIK